MASKCDFTRVHCYQKIIHECIVVNVLLCTSAWNVPLQCLCSLNRGIDERHTHTFRLRVEEVSGVRLLEQFLQKHKT